MEFYPNSPITLSHEEGKLTNITEKGGNNDSLIELLSQQTIEVDENSEWLSVFVEDCFSSPGNYNLAPENQQLITKTGNVEPLGTLKPQQLFNPCTVKNPEENSENPTRKRTRKTVMKLKTHKTPSVFELDNWTPELDPPMLQQSHWLADSELILPMKHSYYAKEECCTGDKRMFGVDSSSPELYIEYKSDKKDVSKQRRCTHCQAEETPHWRQGPLGKGTLCNACGLRFMKNAHANVCHKVPEMREARLISAAVWICAQMIQYHVLYEKLFTNFNYGSEEGADNEGHGEIVPHQTIEGDENSERLSLFVKDCFSSSPDYILTPATQQAFSRTANPKRLGNLKLQLHNSSSMEICYTSERPTRIRKRKRKTKSLMEVKSPSSGPNKYILSLKLESNPDPPLLLQTQSLADSELIFPIKQNSASKEESFTKKKANNAYVSPSPELYIEPKPYKKNNVSKPRRQRTQRLANHELMTSVNQMSAAKEESSTKEKAEEVALSPTPELYIKPKFVKKKKKVSKPTRCAHCQTGKTPQWREGPLGKGTLCNACGLTWLRFGMLFPEYRPANSPTFMSNLHSNARCKLLKMRETCQFSSAVDLDYSLSRTAGIRHDSEEGSDNGNCSEVISQQTTEGDENSEHSSVSVKDCFSSPGDYIVTPSIHQLITRTSKPRPLESLKLQLHNPSPVRNSENSEKPAGKRNQKSTSLMELKTSSILSPKMESYPDSPLHQQTQRFTHFEPIFPIKQNSTAKEKSFTKKKADNAAVSLSPELYIEPNSDKKISKPRRQLLSQRLADSEPIFPLKQNFAAKEESCTQEKVDDVALPLTPERYIGHISDNKKVPKPLRTRCNHCQTMKTPHWREGPLAKGTLCNAYANSTMLVSDLHSNVLHKVLEMREICHSFGAGDQ